MSITGTIAYDPVHRVPSKKEYAVKRTYGMKAIELILKCLPYAQATQLLKINLELEVYMKDPHRWIRKGNLAVATAEVDRLYTLLAELATDTRQLPCHLEVTLFLADIHSRLCKTETRPWTAIVRVDRRLIKPHLDKLRADKIIISPSAWGPHITWVKNEPPKNPETWGLYEGLDIPLGIEPVIKTNGVYYWLDVEAVHLYNFREQLGLTPKPAVPLHLTIGRTVK